VVSVALVAHREVEETSASADVLPRVERENKPTRSDMDQDKERHHSGCNPKDITRKKVVQRPVYFVSSI